MRKTKRVTKKVTSKKSNHPEYQYLDLLQEILKKGVKNHDLS